MEEIDYYFIALRLKIIILKKYNLNFISNIIDYYTVIILITH